MSGHNLAIFEDSSMGILSAVPLATEADFETNTGTDRSRMLASGDDSYAYLNAATCPDCSGGMVRQGRCCVCPSCGFESCAA